MTRAIAEAVRRYFQLKGYVEEPPPPQGPSLSFKGPSGRVAVYLIDEEALKARGEALRRLLRASSTDGYDLAYVAVSKPIATVVDASILHEVGVGMLIVDGQVLEATPAKRRMTLNLRGLEELRRQLSALEEKVRRLETGHETLAKPVDEELAFRVNRLEGEVAELRANLEDGLRRLLSSLTSILDKIASLESMLSEMRREHKPMVEATPLREEAPPSELPSFFKDNPWLRILSTRGRE